MLLVSFTKVVALLALSVSVLAEPAPYPLYNTSIPYGTYTTGTGTGYGTGTGVPLYTASASIYPRGLLEARGMVYARATGTGGTAASSGFPAPTGLAKRYNIRGIERVADEEAKIKNKNKKNKRGGFFGWF